MNSNVAVNFVVAQADENEPVEPEASYADSDLDVRRAPAASLFTQSPLHL